MIIWFCNLISATDDVFDLIFQTIQNQEKKSFIHTNVIDLKQKQHMRE